MKIGELARLADCKVVTIRYYEQRGLMRKPGRTVSNYRDYDATDVQRLQFIRHCRRHGMTLEEITELVSLDEENGECRDIHGVIKKQLAMLESQIKSLKQLETELRNLLSRCSGSDSSSCAIMQELKSVAGCSSCRKTKKAL